MLNSNRSKSPQEQSISIQANFIILLVFLLASSIVFDCFRYTIAYPKKLVFPASIVLSDLSRSLFWAIMSVGIIVSMLVKRKNPNSRFHNRSQAFKRVTSYGLIGALISGLLAIFLASSSAIPNILAYVLTSKN